jgi:soluble lytic murein transglycosylase-like protein
MVAVAHPLPSRAPVVPSLLVGAFALLVAGLLAADAAGGGAAVVRSAASAPDPVADRAATAAPPAVTSLPVVDAASVYRVRPRDTLSRIAALHAVPMGQLAAANRLAPPYPLNSGETLAVPAPPIAAAATPPANAPMEASVERWAIRYDLPPALLKAVTWRESRWDPSARSRRGAVGVGQVLPSTAAWVSERLIGSRLDPWQVEENLHLSAAYLRWLIDRAGGDQATALAAYHQGRTSVLQEGWFPVTQRYVEDVFSLRWEFEAAAPQR